MFYDSILNVLMYLIDCECVAGKTCFVMNTSNI